MGFLSVQELFTFKRVAASLLRDSRTANGLRAQTVMQNRVPVVTICMCVESNLKLIFHGVQLLRRSRETQMELLSVEVIRGKNFSPCLVR